MQLLKNPKNIVLNLLLCLKFPIYVLQYSNFLFDITFLNKKSVFLMFYERGVLITWFDVNPYLDSNPIVQLHNNNIGWTKATREPTYISDETCWTVLLLTLLSTGKYQLEVMILNNKISKDKLEAHPRSRVVIATLLPNRGSHSRHYSAS